MLVQNKSLKDSIFLGFTADDPFHARLPRGIAVQTVSQSFEFLAHLCSQARLKGKRVVWVSPKRTQSEFAPLNTICQSSLQLRDFQFGVPCDAFNFTQQDSVIFCRKPAIHHPGFGAAIASLPAQLMLSTLQQLSAEVSSEPTRTPLSNTLFIFENLPLASYADSSCNFLQEFKNLGASWVVTTSEHLENMPAVQAAAADIVDMHDFAPAQLSFPPAGPLKTALMHTTESESYPQSVWQPHCVQPLGWISQGLDKQADLINGLTRHSKALTQVFIPNLRTQPEFWLGAGVQSWYYNVQGERVLLEQPLQRTPLETSTSALFNLMMWGLKANKNISDVTGPANYTKQRLAFQFEAKIHTLSQTTALFSFDQLCEVFSNVLAEHDALLRAAPVTQWQEDTPFWANLGGHTMPRFEELPARLRMLFWLQAYQFGQPVAAHLDGHGDATLRPPTHPGVLGLAVPEDLNLQVELHAEEIQAWELLMRQARQATYSFFFSDSANYSAVIKQYEEGGGPENSLLSLICQYMDAVYAESSAQL